MGVHVFMTVWVREDLVPAMLLVMRVWPPQLMEEEREDRADFRDALQVGILDLPGKRCR